MCWAWSGLVGMKSELGHSLTICQVKAAHEMYLSQTVHSHRSCDVPQLRTDFSYLYIVILVYLCFPLSLKIDYDTLVYFLSSP